MIRFQYQSLAEPTFDAGCRILTEAGDFIITESGTSYLITETGTCPPEVITTQFLPQYPDKLFTRANLNYGPVWVGPIAPPVEEPAPDLSWKGSYPDIVPGRARINYGPTESLTLALAQLPAEPLSWQPSYPSLSRSSKPYLEAANHPYLFFVNALPHYAIPELSWRGVYPDRAPGRQPINYGPYLILEVPMALMPVPDLSWEPVYPAMATGREPINYGPSLLETLALPQIPPPELSWSPAYPSQVPGRDQIGYGGVLFWVFAPPPPPLPELTWQPNMPTLVRGALRAHQYNALYFPAVTVGPKAADTVIIVFAGLQTNRSARGS